MRKLSIRAIATLLATTLSVSALLASIAVVRPTGARRSLIVGIDDSRTRVSDGQQRIVNLLQSTYGFESSNIRRLTGREATSPAIRAALKELASTSKPGDSLFVYLDVPVRGEYFIGAGDDPEKPWQSLQLFELADLLAAAPASGIFVVVPTCERRDAGAKVSVPNVSQSNRPYQPETVQATLAFCREDTPEFASNFADVLDQFARGSELQIPVSAVYRELQQRKLPYVNFEADPAVTEFTFVRQQARVARSVDLIKGASSAPLKEKAIEDVVRALGGGKGSSNSPEVREVAVLLSNIAASPNEPRSARLKALWGIGELKSASAIPALERVFENARSDPAIRRTIVEAFARIGTVPAIELVHRAVNDASPDVRIAALRAATTVVGDRDLTARVIQALGDPDADVRVTALQSIANLKVIDAADEVLATLRDPSPQVRREAVSTLAAIGAPIAQAEFLEVARTDPDESVRQAIVFALGRSKTEPPTTERVVAQLLEFTRAPTAPAVREAAAWSLGQLGGGRAEMRLRELLRASGESAGVRKNAAEGLGKQKSRSALPELRQALQDPDSSVRRAAAEALGMIGDRSAFSPLLRALDDPDPYVKAAATKALETVVPTASQARELLKNRDPEIRAAAVYQLGRDPAFARELAELLADEDYRVREATVQALQVSRNPDSVRFFISLLDDKRFLMRQGAAAILGRLGDESALEALRARASDPASGVRAEAVRALGRISGAVAEETIVKGAADPDANVRLAAAEALASVGTPRAQETLARLANDPSQDVRQVAVRALRGPTAY